MTARQGLATGSISAPAVPTNGALVHGDHPPSNWEEWFLHASPRQRTDALGLAQQQGLLYPHQLPTVSNGKQQSHGKETAIAALLVRLLAGKTETLPTLQPETLTFFDAQLDDVQRQAVLRAVSTPDIFLLDGLPGAGKSRVVTEIILQYARRGRRVLFLAPHAAALDVVLARLIGRSEIFPLRLVDALEKIDALPAALRGFTLEEQRQSFLARTLAGARSNRERHDANCRQRGDETAVWSELHACAERLTATEVEQRRLSERVAHAAAAVESEPSVELAAKLQPLRTACDHDVRQLETQLQEQQQALKQSEQQQADCAARIAALEPGYQAKKHGRIWSLAYWTNLFNGGIIAEMESLQQQDAQAQQQIKAVQEQIAQLEAQRNARRDAFDRARLDASAAEIEARRQSLQNEQQRLDAERVTLDETWSKLCARLSSDVPGERHGAAVTAAQQAWSERCKHDERRCQFARQWLQFVEESGADLAARLPALSNLIASTIQRWHSDAKLQAASGTPFDLVIIEDAEALTDADLLRIARHGERVVLVTQAIVETPPHDKPVRPILTASMPTTSACHRLWQALGGAAGRWPCTWRREQGRLLCQLVPLSAEDMQHLESEGLADAADIELRILHRPRSTPRLAQVIFGPQHSFEDGFRFLVSEVQEFPLAPLGQTSWWSEDDTHVRRHLGPSTVRMHGWLTIEPGLKLGMAADDAGAATTIAVIEFDKSAGWDRARADDWLGRHQPIQDAERTAFLQTPYRFGRSLARLVQSVLRCADWLDLPADHGMASTGCEFIAVPGSSKSDWPGEGAGLELDLTATRQAERLPAGLRHGLPLRGFVNYPEAQAVIRRLETLAQNNAPGRRVAVLALYQGQVELLRRLVQQSEILRGRGLEVEVALPSRMRQRECDIVLLSLTRSHAQRAVAFGEDVLELPLALTRSTGSLIVFGDPGTLSKRARWTGPLDHLDARAAQEELHRCQRLLAYLQANHPVHVNGAANGVV